MMGDAIRIIRKTVNFAFLGFVDFESRVGGRAIGPSTQVLLQGQQISFGCPVKKQDAILPALALSGNNICSPEIFQRNNALV